MPRAHVMLLVCACEVASPATQVPETVAEVVPPPRAQPEFLKGQLHLHSSNSGDSRTPPEQVARWYAAHGYDFIVFTDHGRITKSAGVGEMLVLPGMEITMNVDDCTPVGDDPLCPLHVNALLVDRDEAASAEPHDHARETLYRHGIALARALGGIAQLNHPNFHHGADAQLITKLAADGPLLLEVANLAVDSNNDGDATHPSTEALWDAVLQTGATVWGTATDDAHHYDDAAAVRARGEQAFVGDRGWVMVRAAREPEAIREALLRGDFYASSGVTLGELACSDAGLRVIPNDPHARVVCVADGRPTAPLRGPITCLPGRGYVRARIYDDAGRMAWTQPCRASGK